MRLLKLEYNWLIFTELTQQGQHLLSIQPGLMLAHKLEVCTLS